MIDEPDFAMPERPNPDVLGGQRVRQMFDSLLQWREEVIVRERETGRELASLRGQFDLLAHRVAALERRIAALEPSR